MKRTIKLVFAGMMAWILMLSACEKVTFKEPEIILPDSVSYSLKIQPIWDDNCVTCHGGARDPDLRASVSYDELINGAYIDTVNDAQSDLMLKLYGSHNSRATEGEKQLVLQWIIEGAKNN